MRSRQRVLLSLALLLLRIPAAEGRTWRVERYGPADFSTIQPALDAAAPGDTIRIGYGRYTEYQTVVLPGWSWSVGVYAWVRTDNLTIIGMSETGTVIGPLAANFQGFGPKGIVALESVNDLKLEGLGFENLYSGLYLLGGPIDVVHCRFRQCAVGMLYAGNTALHVWESTFLDGAPGGIGIWCNNAGQDILIEDSTFISYNPGIHIQWSSFAVVSRCSLSGGTGIQFADGSTGAIRDCVVQSSGNYCVAVATESVVTLERNSLSGAAYNLTLTSHPVVNGTENILSGARLSSIRCGLCEAVDFHGNHLFNGGGYSVQMDGFSSPPAVTIDLTGNFWGTDDPAQISAWIWDGYDDPSVHGFVDFEPFAGGPIPAERGTWGEVKAMFRDGGK